MSQTGGYDQGAGGAWSTSAPAGGYPPPEGGPGGGQQRPAPPYYVAPTNGLAIAALIVAFVFAPAGLVMGIVAKNQIAQTGEQGEGLATAAIVVSAIFIGMTVLAFVLFFALFATVATNVHIGNTGNSLRLLVGR
jgi:Domain of unknown function (DUF4190)